MKTAEETFTAIGLELADSDPGQMFGKKCFKTQGKAYVCFFQDCMVFKLSGDDHASALGLARSQLFDPSSKGRAMKEWVQVPFEHAATWPTYARAAQIYSTP